MRITYTLCKKCDGVGQNCKLCFGQGLIAHDEQKAKIHTIDHDDENADDEDADDVMIECPDCHGDGEIAGEKCDRCSGSGKIAPAEDVDEDERAAARKRNNPMHMRSLDLLELRSKAISLERNVSVATAMLIACEEDPALYQAYLDEKEAATQTQAGKREFLSAMQRRFAAQGRGTQVSNRQLAPLPRV